MNKKIVLALGAVILIVGGYFVFSELGRKNDIDITKQPKTIANTKEYSKSDFSISLPPQWIDRSEPTDLTPYERAYYNPVEGLFTSADFQNQQNGECTRVDCVITSGYMLTVYIMQKGEWIPAGLEAGSDITLDVLIASAEETKTKDPDVDVRIVTIGEYKGIWRSGDDRNKANSERYLSFDTVKDGAVYQFGLRAPIQSDAKEMEELFTNILATVRLK